MKPTMQDVADFAKVSRATVSRVLGENANVSPEKRKIVLEAVQKLGYEPHKKFRANPDVILLVTFEKKINSFNDRIIEGIRLGVSHNRVRLMVGKPRETDSGYLLKLAKDVEGILILGDLNLARSQYLEIQKRQIPLVIINGIPDYDGFSYIGIDERKTMIQVVQDLVNLHHREIAFISGPQNHLVYQERLRLYKLGLLCSNLSVDPGLIGFAAGDCKNSGYFTTKELLANRVPTAVMAANDDLALGVYQAVSELGLRIPQDVSVIGFGDLEIAGLSNPSLSTIAVPFLSMGMWAVSLLSSLINNRKKSQVRLNVPTDYVKRQSVSKAKL